MRAIFTPCKFFRNHFFHLFRSKILQYKLVATTGCAGIYYRISCAAIMTGQLIFRLMIGKTYIAVFALRYPATYAANLVGRISSAILKKDDLFFFRQ